MSGVNKCIFIGNAGRDAELRSTGSGMSVANVSIGVNSRVGGEDVTEWVSLVFWDKLAEVAADYITKGKQVYVECRMQTRKWQDKDGNDKYATEFHVQQLTLLGGGEDGGGGRGDDRGRAPQRGRGDDRDDRGGRDTRTHGEQRRERTSGYRDEPPARRPPERGGRDSAPPPRRSAPKTGTGFDDMDDDIPFASSCESFDMATMAQRKMKRYRGV